MHRVCRPCWTGCRVEAVPRLLQERVELTVFMEQSFFSMISRSFSLVVGLCAFSLCNLLYAQNAPAPRPQAPAPAGGISVFPQRPPADPAVIERGKGLYSVNC